MAVKPCELHVARLRGVTIGRFAVVVPAGVVALRRRLYGDSVAAARRTVARAVYDKALLQACDVVRGRELARLDRAAALLNSSTS